jgi:hypothetical protein
MANYSYSGQVAAQKSFSRYTVLSGWSARGEGKAYLDDHPHLFLALSVLLEEFLLG